MNSGFIQPRDGFSPPPETVAQRSGLPAAFHELVSADTHVLLDYWGVLKRRRWVLIVTAVIVFSLVTLATLRMTRMYTAVGRLAIYREHPVNLGLKDSAQPDYIDDADYIVDLETQLKILQSDALAGQVAQDLHLPAEPAQDAALQTGPAEPDPLRLSPAAGALLNHLKVRVLPRTRIVQIEFSDPSPRRAAEIANGFANTYIEQNRKAKFDSAMQSSDWLSRQLSDLRLKVETSQEKLVRYQKEHGIIGLDEKQNIVTAKLDELNKNLTAAESVRMQKESLFRLLQGNDPELLTKADGTGLIEKLRQQESELKTKLAQLSAQFGPSYPKVIEVQSQLSEVDKAIAKESQRLSSRIRAEYLSALQQEKLLRQALDAQKQEANNLNESAIEYNVLKRDADSNRQLYEGLLAKLKEAGVSMGLRSGNVRVVDYASVPARPSSPNVPRNLAIGLFLGIGLGGALAFLLDSLDNTVGTPEQAESLTSIPVLGIVPHSEELAVSSAQRPLALVASAADGAGQLDSLVTVARPNSEEAEAYRAFRTSLLLSCPENRPQVVLITSALPQEGKTTTVLNCAAVLAQGGSRVLLVDADMRRSSVQRILGVRPKQGLSTALANPDDAHDAILSTSVNGLFVLPGGPTPPHPAELLSSAGMKRLLTRWRNEYDHVIFDSPPVLAVTDAVVLSVLADAVVLIVRAGRTLKPALRRTEEVLLQVNANLLGVVVNDMSTNADGHHSYYYYGAKYRGEYYEQSGSEQHRISRAKAN